MKRTILVLAILLVLIPTTTAQEQELETWHWPEFGLSFDYPSDWQSSLAVENFAFVLVGEPAPEGGAGFFVSLQTGTYDPSEEKLADIFDQIAGEDTELTETTLGGVDAWQFEVTSDERHAVFYGFGANEDDIALLSLSAPEAQWDEQLPLVDTIVDSTIISEIELDPDMLNQQMQANYEQEGIMGIGDVNAPVHMVEFMDFSCPHCANFADSIDRIAQDYIVDGDVFLQFSVLDIIGGENSQIAALAQVCGTQLGFGWDIHELLFMMFFEGGREIYNVDAIVDAVEDADLDVTGEAFSACMDTESVDTFIEENRTFASEMSVSSTPALMFSANDDSELELDFIRSSSGEAYTGGLPLLVVYDHIDNLLQVDEPTD